MGLERVKKYLEEKQHAFQYTEEDGLGSIDFMHRGLSYHIWEFQDGEICGAETNLRVNGKSEDLTGDYEQEILEILESWGGLIP